MRFGVIMPIQLKDTSLDAHFEELREEVAVAEEAGFDAVFLPEFHQARGGALVSPLLVGAALLQGTTRIRFGSAVLATPLHHPVRLAEDAIMFDWITRGRLVLGLGIAHQVPDFKAYGVPRDERMEVFEEVLDLLELCFAGEPYSYEGRHFTSEGHSRRRRSRCRGPRSRSGRTRSPGSSAPPAAATSGSPTRSDVQTIAKLAATYRRHAEELRQTPRSASSARPGWGQQGGVRARLGGQPDAGAPALLQRRHVQEAIRAVGRRVVERESFTLDRLAPGRFLYEQPRGRSGRGRGVARARPAASTWRSLPPPRRPFPPRRRSRRCAASAPR